MCDPHGSRGSLGVCARECGGIWGPCRPNPPCPLHSPSAQAWCVFIPWSKSFLSSPGGKVRKLEALSVLRKSPAVGFSAQAPEPSPQAHPSWVIWNMGLAPSFPHERAGETWSQLICIDKKLALLSPSYLSFLSTLIAMQKPGRWGAPQLSFWGWVFYGLIVWSFLVFFFLVGCPFFPLNFLCPIPVCWSLIALSPLQFGCLTLHAPALMQALGCRVCQSWHEQPMLV